jgi:HK97 family phage major capsid protein
MRKPIGEQISEALAKRENLLKLHEAIDLQASAAGKPLTDEDIANKAKLEELVAACNSELKALRKRELLFASCTESDVEAGLSQTPRQPAKPDDGSATITGRPRNVETPKWGGHGLALFAHCLHKAGGNAQQAAIYAANRLNNPAMGKVLEFFAMHGDQMHNEMLKAADPGTGTTTGATFVEPLIEWRRAGQMFIEMWRAKTILGRLQTMRLSFGVDGSVTIPRQTAGSVGAWVAEGAAIPVDNIALDSIQLIPRELGTIIILTKKAIEHSNPSALAVVQNDLMEASARTVDVTFLDAAAATTARPRGAFASAGSVTASAAVGALVQMDADAKGLLNHFSSNNIPQTGMAWLMHPAAQREIQFIRDTNGNRVYPEAGQGMWHGIPIIDSTQCDADTIDLVAAGHIIVADDFGPMIDLSTDATLHRDDAPNADIAVPATGVVSMYQTASVAIRLTQGLSWERRRDTVTARCANVNWA